MSVEQLRYANEKARQLRDDYRVHHDARGWYATSTFDFSLDGTTGNTSKQQATLVEPKRTMVECLEWLFEVHHDPKAQSFYTDRALRGLPLDIAPPLTENQKARIAAEQHAAKLGAEKANEAMNKQLRYQMDKLGVTNVRKVRDALRGKR